MANVAYTTPTFSNSTSAARLVLVTPSDTTVLPTTRWLWVGSTGNMAVLPVGQDNAVTINAIPAGTRIEVMATKVMSTNTTGGLIVVAAY